MTAEYPQGDEPLIPMPALSLPALRQAVATVAPSRLPEFFQEIQDAFTQAGDEDSVFPIRHFYQRWGAAIAIGRRPSVAARLHAAERALADPDPACPGPGSPGSRRDRPGGLPRGRRWLTDRPRIDDLPRRAGVHRRAARAAHCPARSINARLPDRRPRRTRGHHPGELDQLTQAAAEAPRRAARPLCDRRVHQEHDQALAVRAEMQ